MARQIIVKAGLEKNTKTQAPLVTQNPFWILITFPYAATDTFDRSRLSSPPQSGFRIVSRDHDESVSTQARVILFDHEIKNWSVSHTKSNHIHAFNCQMHNTDGTLRLLEWLNAGDWCMFWAFRDRKTFEKIRRRLINQHSAEAWTTDNSSDDTSDTDSQVTGWQDGLKFVGRLQSPRHQEFRSADGSFEVGYSITAFGFTELESTIYYDDVIRFQYPNAIEFFQDLGISLEKFLRAAGSDNPGFVNTNVTIPALTQILLGKGPGVLSKDKGDTQMRPSKDRATLQDSPNVQFEIPEPVAKILGDPNQDPLRYYSDILAQIVGDQTFGDNKRDTDPNYILPDVIPDGVTGTIAYTKNPLNDYFPPTMLDMKNQSVWSILKHYVNEPINEIYTVLKPHPVHGGLTPTLVVRRVPYSSDTYQNSSEALKAVPFSALPRWIIPTALMLGYDIGKTDAARINYVHIIPSTMPSSNPATNETLVRLQAPPVVNKVDIMKHGLRTFITPVAGFANPTAESNDANTSRRYTDFIADITLDAHMRYNGTLTTVGLQEPIQPGDNLVFNGILFHIEGINHSGGISIDGSKSFTTQIQISHGIPVTNASNDSTGASANSVDESPKGAAPSTNKSSGKKKKPKPISKEEQKAIDRIKYLDTLDALEEAAANYQEPPEDQIRQLRNDRHELDGIGLVGARVHTERE